MDASRRFDAHLSADAKARSAAGSEHTPGFDDLVHNAWPKNRGRQFAAVLEAARHLSHLGVYNAAIVGVQWPGITYVAREEEWWTHFGRTLREDAAPIAILHPFAPVRFVYGTEDTVGADMPPEIVAPFEAPGPFERNALGEMRTALSGLGTFSLELIDSPACSPSIRDDDPDHSAAEHPRWTVTASVRTPVETTVEEILLTMASAHCEHIPYSTHPQASHVERNRTKRWERLSDASVYFERELIDALLRATLGRRHRRSALMDAFLAGELDPPPHSLDAVIKAVAGVQRDFNRRLKGRTGIRGLAEALWDVRWSSPSTPWFRPLGSPSP